MTNTVSLLTIITTLSLSSTAFGSAPSGSDSAPSACAAAPSGSGSASSSSNQTFCDDTEFRKTLHVYTTPNHHVPGWASDALEYCQAMNYRDPEPVRSGRKSPQLRNLYAQAHPEDATKGALLYVLQKTGKIEVDKNHFFERRPFIKSVHKEADGSFVCMVGLKVYTYAQRSDKPKLDGFTGHLYKDNPSKCEEIDFASKHTLTAREAQKAYPDFFGWPK